MIITELNANFAVPNHIRLEAGPGGLPRVVVTTALAEAHIYLHGAHVTHYAAANQKPLLFMSDKSVFADGKAIRGGVPICFPWFGPNATDAKLPAHGFARTREWSLIKAEVISNATAHIVLELKSDDATRALWPFDFVARYTIMIDTHLRLALHVQNTGSKPLRFEEALHSYFSVGDIRQTKVSGLAGVPYADKTRGGAITPQADTPITFTEETDRVYQNTTAACLATDPVLGRTIEVDKDNAQSTIVWNPWIAKAKAMAEFGDDEWPRMLCIESANVGSHAIDLPPGGSHTMSVRLSSSK